MAPKVSWNAPEETPPVPLGTEQLFWVAIHNLRTDKVRVELAYYQNRPLQHHPDGQAKDWVLLDHMEEPVHSVGWVENKRCDSFDDFYEHLDLNGDYQLAGWAEYQPPAFKRPSTQPGKPQ
ncbi:hypothetical protein [Ferrimonas marina]|uniref:Uncharacterized protein n=1 Tax=Ferrimonas marina TaxID=299255 RepID=A0A1M5U019_9GAMM|nr:hypothetical protein [Ferrimonas marina]SHH56200.1 hypothetical protein SAMN02745129_2344 [Ferrimonas marina]